MWILKRLSRMLGMAASLLYRDNIARLNGVINDAKEEAGARCSCVTFQAKRLVDLHFMDDNINLKRVAKELNLTPDYVGKLFKRDIGKSFNSYLNAKRIEKAQELLQTSPNKLKVTALGLEVGFKSYAYFHKIFKSITGFSPTEMAKILSQKVA